MRTMRDRDVSSLVQLLPPRVATALMETPGACVAGGFVRDGLTGYGAKDIDLFCPRDAVHDLAERLGGSYFAAVSKLAMTWPPFGVADVRPVQLVTGSCADTPAKVLADFDFTVCQGALFFADGWLGVCSDRFYDDLREKRLTYTGQPGSDLIGHMLRLVARGYVANRITVAKVLAAALDLPESRTRDALCNGYDEPVKAAG